MQLLESNEETRMTPAQKAANHTLSGFGAHYTRDGSLLLWDIYEERRPTREERRGFATWSAIKRAADRAAAGLPIPQGWIARLINRLNAR
jgi:hypothetical protein